MQQQQQEMNYDLLAVFTSEVDTEVAENKLHKEGFGDEEVHRLTSDYSSRGEFREHGPNRNRSEVFLQTSRTGPNPVVVILLAIVCGLILGGVMFGVADFAIKSLNILSSTIAGAVVGIILGAAIGLLQRGRVRGNIGQGPSRAGAQAAAPAQGARTVIAVRLQDPENISRKSKARAILINSKGKIDRSVGRDS